MGRIKLPARLTVITPTEVEKGCTLGIYVCMVLCKAMKSLGIYQAVFIFWTQMNIKTLRRMNLKEKRLNPKENAERDR